MNIIIYILLLILILFIINELIDNKYKKETYNTLENNEYINSHCLDNNSILQLNNTLNNLSTNELQNLLIKQNITYDDIIQYNINQELNKQELNKQELNKQELNKQELIKQELNKQELNKQELNKQELNKQELIKQELDKQELNNYKLNSYEVNNKKLINQELINQELINQELIKQELNNQELINQELIKQELNNQELNNQELIKQELNNQELNNIKNGIEIIMPNSNNTNIARIAYESGKTPLGINSNLTINMEELQKVYFLISEQQKVKNEYNNVLNENILNENVFNEGRLNKNILNENVFNEGRLNKNIINESILNESILNESILNKNTLNKNVLNENILNKDCKINFPSKIIKKYFNFYINKNDCSNIIYNINDLCSDNSCSQTSQVVINIWTDIYSKVSEIIKIEMSILIELKKKIIEKKLLVTFFLDLINKYNELIDQLLVFLNLIKTFSFNNIFFCSTSKIEENTIIEISYLKKCVSDLKIINNSIQNYNDIIILNDIMIISNKFDNFINNL
jgi:hypothetical protein